MAAVPFVSKLASWQVNGHSICIEYPPSILAEINVDVIDGFNRFRRGGIEVGGVLFGTRQDERIRVLAFRALACEHVFGPNFVLSARDRLALDKVFESVLTDHTLQGLIPVGWYRSRTRAGIHLSVEDVEIFDRYFPQLWQIALVLRPEPFVATKAGFFFREASGSMRTESSYAEFSLAQSTSESKPDVGLESKDAPVSQIQEPPVEQAQPVLAKVMREESPASPLLFQQPSTRIPSTVRSILYAAALGLAFAGVYFGMARNPPRPTNQQSLIVEERGGQLWISWDPKRWESGTKARLEIHEGDQTTSMDLDKTQLRSGSVTYARQSGDVWVRMQSETSEEWVAFVSTSSDPSQVRTNEEKESGRRQINQQADEIRRLEHLVENFNSKEKTSPARINIKGRPFHAPAREVLPATIPSFEPPPMERSGWPLTSPALLGNLAASAAIPAPPRATRARTGTVIWTGRLARNGVITIDGNRPSIGALTGEVPGIPVRVHVHPAELTEEGLTVYTAETKYPDGYSEPAGPTNGWNRTRYLRDPTRVRSLGVVEPPSAANGWKRLVLRSNQSSLSVVLVGWDVL